MIALLSQHGRYGYGRITAKRADRCAKIVGNVCRCGKDLKLPLKQKPKGMLRLDDGSCVRLRP